MYVKAQPNRSWDLYILLCGALCGEVFDHSAVNRRIQRKLVKAASSNPSLVWGGRPEGGLSVATGRIIAPKRLVIAYFLGCRDVGSQLMLGM